MGRSLLTGKYKLARLVGMALPRRSSASPMKTKVLVLLATLMVFASAGYAGAEVSKIVARARLDLDNAPAVVATAITQEPDDAAAILTGALVQIPERALAILRAALEVMPERAKEFVRIAILAQPKLSPEIVTTALTLYPDQAAELIAAAVEVAPEDVRTAIAAPGNGNGATFDPSGRIPGTFRGKPPAPPFPAQPIRPGLVSPSR